MVVRGDKGNLSEKLVLSRCNAYICVVLGGERRSSAYQGADRRRRSPDPTHAYSVPQLLLAGNLIAAVALGLPLLAAYIGDRMLPPELFTSQAPREFKVSTAEHILTQL